jgi:hypothetical protein
MNRPSLVVRVAGSPLPALVLLGGYALMIVGWYQGHVVWWLALVALSAALRTLSAVGTLRRYKAWQAEWNAMGAKDQSARPARKKIRRGVFITGAALLLLAIPVCLSQVQSNEELLTKALSCLWLTALVYLGFVALCSIVRPMVKRPNAPAKEADDAPVEWLLGSASSSPSRSEAARKLPEYASRLLSS